MNVCYLGLGTPGGHSPAEQRWCMCGSAVWQALGAWPGRAGMVKACGGLQTWVGCGPVKQRSCVCVSLAWHALGVWPGGYHECLWIPGLAGLNGSFGVDRVGLNGGSLG
jgi:hypothetical protein